MDDWKSDLDSFFEAKASREEKQSKNLEANRKRVSDYISSVVIPAFEELKIELEKHGREVTIHMGSDLASLEVNYQMDLELDYRFKVRISAKGTFPYPETRFMEQGKRYIAEGYFRSGSQDFTIEDLSREEIIKSFLVDYKNHMSR